MKFSEKVVKARQLTGLTQADLAMRIDATLMDIQKWENGEAVPSPKVLLSFNNVCGSRISLETGSGVTEEFRNSEFKRSDDWEILSKKSQAYKDRCVFFVVLGAIALIFNIVMSIALSNDYQMYVLYTSILGLILEILGIVSLVRVVRFDKHPDIALSTNGYCLKVAHKDHSEVTLAFQEILEMVILEANSVAGTLTFQVEYGKIIAPYIVDVDKVLQRITELKTLYFSENKAENE